MIAFPISDELAAATKSYLNAFGHPVPDEVIERSATRAGPLLLEIRQAIALQRPVKSWLERSRNGPLGSDGPSHR
jgi:hypothetical protein